MLWCLISHLSLNYLSLVQEGKESLQKILELYDFSSSPDVRKQIRGMHPDLSVGKRRHAGQSGRPELAGRDSASIHRSIRGVFGRVNVKGAL